MENQNSANESSTLLTANRYVGFIDIMGFKDLVARNTSSFIYDKLLQSVGRIRESAEAIKKLFVDDYLNIHTFSDSIIIFSKQDSVLETRQIIIYMSYVIQELFKANLPAKGALAYGELTIDQENQIFFGQPLIDAYQLQEKLKFYGLVIHGSAQKQIFETLEPPASGVFKHNCNFEKSKSYHHTIIPLNFYRDNPIYDELKSNNLPKSIDDLLIKMEYGTSGELRQYIDNTREYFRAVVDHINALPETLIWELNTKN